MIDWAKVLELRSEIGAEDFAEVVDLFLDEVEGVVDELRGGLDRGAWESRLHFLKGSALNLGFSALSDLCCAGEAAAAKGQFADIDLGRVVDVYVESKDRFLAELSDRLAA